MPSPESKLIEGLADRYGLGRMVGQGGGEFRPGRPSFVAEGSFLRTLGWNYTLGLDGRLAAFISTPGDLTRELGVITRFDHDLTRWAPPQREP